jgi:hypothetical protein
MITNTGKEIIGKYLVEQADSYASYLAIGSGPKPLALEASFGDYSDRTSLEFETLRVPIISKSLITDSGLTRVVLTAELPTEERYEITEVGVYPAANNPIATGLDSRPLILFDGEELWESHPSVGDVVPVPLQLDSIANDATNDIIISDKVFYTNSNNSVFQKTNYPDRVERHERPRFLDRAIFVRGNLSSLTVNDSDLTASGDHIHLAINPIDLTKNSTNDELRLAFSVVNRNGTETGESPNVPSNVKILIQFANTDGASPQYASFVVNLNNGTSPGQWDFSTNRYVVVSKKISELYKTPGFSWDTVTTVKVYVSVTATSPLSGADFYVALDALKLENVSSFSNVYGLTAYTVMKTSDSLAIVKSDNTASFIEFSYLVDVL